ncbi:MAG: YraN family protein [Coriobacteriaceae bacterium]|nr:YraN family protein [Coriobacteriaceae bacterium]
MRMTPDDTRRNIGARGEDAAAAYLENAGMKLEARNWRCPTGEIDVVARDGQTLVLCEVKTRRTVGKGLPEEAVGPAKQKRLAKLARAYIATLAKEPAAVRFDVVTLLVIAPDRALLRHHRSAFVVDER